MDSESNYNESLTTDLNMSIQGYLNEYLVETEPENIFVIPSDEHLIDLNNNNNQELTHLLKSWNMTDEVIKKFISMGIDMESLKFMRLAHIQEYFPKNLAGLRIKFEHYLFTWQKENGTYEPPICSCNLQTSIISNNQARLESTDIQTGTESGSTLTSHSSDFQKSLSLNVSQILQSKEEGKNVILFYNINQVLEPHHRTTLTHMIIQKYIENGLQLSVFKIKQIAKQIIELFPTEIESTYFIGRGKLPPKGKLYDRYQNRKKLMKKMSVSINQTQSLVSEKATDSPANSEQSANDSEMHEISNVLKHIREPWELIKEKWFLTRSYRTQQILTSSDMTIADMLKSWPLYTHSKAPELMEIDFHYMYPEKSLFKNWDLFTKYIPPIFKKNIKDKRIKPLLDDIMTQDPSQNIDFKNVTYVQLLHALLKPSQRASTTKSRIKHSIKDSQESLMITVETHNEIITKIQEMKNLCLSNHSKLQPFIVGVREKDKLYNEYVVVLDDIKFKFETFLSALDLCFKLFQVLHISYPKESILVWNFIQRFFYDVQTKYDDDSPVIATLISDLKNAIKINEA